MMKYAFFLTIASIVTLNSFAQSNQITKKKFFHGKMNEQDSSVGYTEAVLVDNILYISGWIGKGTVSEQLHEIYTKLGEILTAYGATYQNVVKENLFATDIEAVKSNNAVRKLFYKGDYPAATWIQITKLFDDRPDAQIEVELIAHLPKEDKRKK